MIEKFNNSINLIGLALVVISLAFVHMGQGDIAKDIVIGVLGFIGGASIKTQPPNA